MSPSAPLVRLVLRLLWKRLRPIAASLAAKPVVVAHKAGADGRLFGTVKAEAIAEAIEAAGIGSVDKRTIHLGSAIKRTGEYKVTVRLHADVVANVVLDVVAAA